MVRQKYVIYLSDNNLFLFISNFLLAHFSLFEFYAAYLQHLYKDFSMLSILY